MPSGIAKTPIIVNCIICSNPFTKSSNSAKICPDCKTCPECKKPLGSGSANPHSGRALCRACTYSSKKYKENQSQAQVNMLDPSTEFGSNRREEMSQSALNQFDSSTSKGRELRKRISEARQKEFDITTEDGRKRRKEASKRFRRVWAEHHSKWKEFGFGSSKLEDKVAPLIGDDWIRQFSISWYTVDFAIPSLKIALEVQGCYWHVCEKCFPTMIGGDFHKKSREKDKRKRRLLTKWGWKVIEIWEHEVDLIDITSESLLQRGP